MRSKREIQKAHDKLLAIALGEAKADFFEFVNKEILAEMADILCWVLEHENENFQLLLNIIDNIFFAYGIKEIDFGHKKFD